MADWNANIRLGRIGIRVCLLVTFLLARSDPLARAAPLPAAPSPSIRR
jgi:hypothetical protein